MGHNIIDYDLRVLSDLLHLDFSGKDVLDTLVLSRLLKYKLDGGHSLEAWGERLGYKKSGLNMDFSVYSKGMLKRCADDVEINLRVYRYLEKKILKRKDFDQAVKVEHDIARVCLDMHKNGFYFNVGRAIELRDELASKIEKLDEQILASFPPKVKGGPIYTPRLTKHGTISRSSIPRSWGPDLTNVSADCPFQLIEWVPFNPGSTSQIVERLHGYWSPTDKTEGHLEAEKDKDKEKLRKYAVTGWKVNEKNLATLKPTAPPGAKYLVERLLLAGRWRTLNEWLACVDASDSSVHARFNGIGTWTHRMSHQEPNMGNVAAPKSIKYKTPELAGQAVYLGGEMRALWGVPPEACTEELLPENERKSWWLIGTDATGIQLRIFAHYINDDEFTHALIKGKSSDGSDVHSRNAAILGCDRDTAKTFIYAFLLGAGDAKLGEILGVGPRAGREAKERFIAAYPGLERLKKELIPSDAERGYFVGLDGRLVPCDSEHLMLAGYLQNGEACIMKHACIRWRQLCDEQAIRYRHVNFVHDEWQTAHYGYRTTAELIGATQRSSIEWVGESFKLRCPMGGESKIGRNWHETH